MLQFIVEAKAMLLVILSVGHAKSDHIVQYMREVLAGICSKIRVVRIFIELIFPLQQGCWSSIFIISQLGGVHILNRGGDSIDFLM